MVASTPVSKPSPAQGWQHDDYLKARARDTTRARARVRAARILRAAEFAASQEGIDRRVADDARRIAQAAAEALAIAADAAALRLAQTVYHSELGTCTTCDRTSCTC